MPTYGEPANIWDALCGQRAGIDYPIAQSQPTQATFQQEQQKKADEARAFHTTQLDQYAKQHGVLLSHSELSMFSMRSNPGERPEDVFRRNDTLLFNMDREKLGISPSYVTTSTTSTTPAWSSSLGGSSLGSSSLSSISGSSSLGSSSLSSSFQSSFKF